MLNKNIYGLKLLTMDDFETFKESGVNGFLSVLDKGSRNYHVEDYICISKTKRDESEKREAYEIMFSKDSAHGRGGLPSIVCSASKNIKKACDFGSGNLPDWILEKCGENKPSLTVIMGHNSSNISSKRLLGFAIKYYEEELSSKDFGNYHFLNFVFGSSELGLESLNSVLPLVEKQQKIGNKNFEGVEWKINCFKSWLNASRSVSPSGRNFKNWLNFVTNNTYEKDSQVSHSVAMMIVKIISRKLTYSARLKDISEEVKNAKVKDWVDWISISHKSLSGMSIVNVFETLNLTSDQSKKWYLNQMGLDILEFAGVQPICRTDMQAILEMPGVCLELNTQEKNELIRKAEVKSLKDVAGLQPPSRIRII